MKIKTTTALMAALAMTACSANTEKTTAEQADTATDIARPVTEIQGKWHIDEVASADTMKIADYSELSIVFANDGSFGVTTTCNNLGGSYTLAGDSLTLSNTLSTMMDCEDMTAETVLSRMLPEVKTVKFTSDSTATLSTATESDYIVISRMAD